jgi:hypothetical protein
VPIGDVDVVVGMAAAKAWRDELSTAAALLDAGEIQAIWIRLRTQAASTDKREAAESTPPTVTRLYWTAVASLMAALGSVLAVLYAVRWTGTTWSGYATACVAVVAGAAARQTASLRYPALGWLTGAVVVSIALIAMQLVV